MTYLADYKDWYSTLFDEGESTCFAFQANEAAAAPVSQWPDRMSPFVCLNPLRSDRDLDPESSLLPWAHAGRGRRADVNVLAFRNILIEMDTIPLKGQFPIVRDCGMPYSTSVYSGGKSLHFVISFAEVCSSREQYDTIVDLVHRSVPAKVDEKCKNPSRLTRAPGAIRKDTGKEQKLIEVRQRVSIAEVVAWTKSRGTRGPEPTEAAKEFIKKRTEYTHPPAWVMNFLKNGAQGGERNQTAFRAACGLARCKMSESDILSAFSGVPGLWRNAKERMEIAKTVKSAVRRVKI